ncbi:MAG: DNA repair protein RecO [Limnohabitans sp.]|nr:DNA repair protein RecO [Limnohabitans sp.]
MLVKTKAIVLSAIRYQEKSLIVKCFTFSEGLKSYFVPSAFSTKKSNQRIAYFQPLTLLEIEANHKNKGTLEYFKEIKIDYPFRTVYSSIYKSTIVLFLSEVLHHSIYEEKNEALFEFLESALIWLDNHEEVANFHLILLLELSKFFGFYPDASNNDLPFFDIVEGCFEKLHGLNSISENETFLFKKLLQVKFDSNQKIFSSNDRQILLKILLDYYTIHLQGFKKPKSLDVFREIFS